MYIGLMKFDETHLPKDAPEVKQRLGVGSLNPAMAPHSRAASEREEDALEAWRNSLDGHHGRPPPDPVSVHGYDIDSADDATRRLIDGFTADLARIHEALLAAEERLHRAELARRTDPGTGLLRRDAFIRETWHLEALDRQERGESTLAALVLEGMHRFRIEAGWARGELAIEAIGKVLAEAVSPAEPAGRLFDSGFAVLLTGLSGEAARRRAAEFARALVYEINENPKLAGLRPARVSVGCVDLHSQEEPYHALERALREAN